MKTFSIVGLVLMGLLVEKRLTSAANTTSTPPKSPASTITTSAPTLEYSCFMDGTVTLNTKSLTGTFQAFAVGQYSALGKTTNCSTQITVIDANNANFTLTNCNPTEPIYVYLSDDTTFKDKVIGGKNFHEYKISCTIPGEGIIAVVAKNLSVTNEKSPTAVTKDFIPSPLSMSFNASTVEIGAALTVNITSTGSKNYHILPYNCSARSVPENSNGETIELLQNGKTKDTDVLTDFNVETTGKATATLYAFRFIDSETVNFECIVTFCETKTCVSGAYNATTAKRRRRAAEEIGHGEKYQVSASFRVVDPEEVQPTSSQSVVRFHPTLTTFLVFLGTVAARRFNRECLF